MNQIDSKGDDLNRKTKQNETDYLKLFAPKNTNNVEYFQIKRKNYILIKFPKKIVIENSKFFITENRHFCIWLD